MVDNTGFWGCNWSPPIFEDVAHIPQENLVCCPWSTTFWGVVDGSANFWYCWSSPIIEVVVDDSERFRVWPVINNISRCCLWLSFIYVILGCGWWLNISWVWPIINFTSRCRWCLDKFLGVCDQLHYFNVYLMTQQVSGQSWSSTILERKLWLRKL